MRRGKGSTVPSDNQAREKLALYVYEYLLHVGAQKAAQTFLSEIRWEKNITLGEPPGFLHSWWCVFWDLYCAAPERRDTCEHSSEAKAFHDYGFVNSGYAVNGMAHNPSAPSPLGQMPPNEGMPGGPIGPGGFFPNAHMRPSTPQQPVSQPSPHSQPPTPHGQMMQNQVFMSPRYPGGPRPGVRMAQQVDFNPPGGVPGQPMMPNSMDPSRQGEGGEFVGWQGPPGMSPMNPRMNPPRGQPLGTMNPGNYGAIRPPPNSGMGPGGPGMSMPGPVGRPWQPNASTISYSSASPGGHYGPPVSSTGPPVPGTPIMPNPQGTAGPYSPAAPRMNAPNTRRDSSNSGGDGMYTLMKTVPGGNMPGFPMGPGPDGPMGPMGPDMGPPVMNGMSSTGDGLDGMKNSPANGPGTPREDGPPMSEFGIPGYGQENDQNESAAILKIKESMQEEAKRFEKATPSEHSEYFMQ
ncbi:single-stranded DNA-binding protein 3-like isoform X7 [Tachypleus tridentatus]|uniref:single-stranded DNA-binding protein 3-like isoform X7 n=1 Tax=Tachypleus tridentatus TaxID=6853 RepID=UPI003FD583CF